MPGPLQHSVGDVVRRLIVDRGWGVEYADDRTSWATFEGVEPDLPDDCITVYDTLGIDHGRNSATGERAESHGFQVRVRSKTKSTGFAKLRQIAVGFDEDVYLATVSVDDVEYLIQSIKRNGEPMYIGHEAPNSKRFLHTLNCVVSLRETGEAGGDMVLQESEGFLILE